MIELSINGKILDPLRGSGIEINRQVGIIADIETRKFDHTQTMLFPMSANNRAILENAQSLTANTSLPYMAIPNADLSQNGIPIVSGGVAYILEIENENFKVFITSNSGAIVEQWKSKSLRDLDFSEFDHIYQSSLINPYNNNTYLEGFIYPFINYNEDITGTTLYVYPAMFVLAVVKKCFEQYGYTVNSTLFDDNFMQNLIIPFASGVLSYGNRFFDLYSQNWEVGTHNTYYDTFTSDPTYDLDFTNTSLVGSLVIGSDFYGFLVGNINNPIIIPSSANYTVQFYDVAAAQFITAAQNFTIGMVIDVYLTITVSMRAGAPAYSTQITIDSISISTAFEDNIINFGDVMNCECLLPDITQAVFMKSFLQIAGAFFETDEIEKTAKIWNFNDLYASKGNAPDITQNIANKNEFVYFTPSEYAQKNTFDWTYKEYNGGGGNFTIANTKLEKEKKILTNVFVASGPTDANGLIHIPMIPITGAPKDCGARLGFINRQVTTIPLVGTLNFAFTYFDFPGFGQNLNWNSLLQTYYPNFTAKMLGNYRKIKILAHFTPQFVRSLEFGTPIYAQQLGDYYFVEKIEGFNNDSKMCNLYLIKMN